MDGASLQVLQVNLFMYCSRITYFIIVFSIQPFQYSTRKAFVAVSHGRVAYVTGRIGRYDQMCKKILFKP